jgi:hypothetical protein
MARGGQLTGVGHLWLRDTTQGACVKTSTATTHHHVHEPSAQRQISGLERPRRLARASVCWTGEAPRIFVPRVRAAVIFMLRPRRLLLLNSFFREGSVAVFLVWGTARRGPTNVEIVKYHIQRWERMID